MLALGLLLVAAPAGAKDDEPEGIDVTIKVLDEAGMPVPTAVVRHPDEQFRHPVNTFDGSWTDSILYLPDGSEIVFEKGMEVEFEISAPGYMNQRFVYLIKKRKNVVPVTLQKMDLSSEDLEADDPVIQFGRDKPIDGAPVDGG
jgi:hypothetical protein